MPDEVLTNLCSVCHAEPHKYKCPGCGARTCSLPCIKKHKSRTDCSGRHNPTQFVPIEKLRTAAGIDHDYNFISAIDRAKRRAQRDIVEELGLFSQEELHPEDEDERAFYKVWKGDQLHHVLDKNRDRLQSRYHFDKHVLRRLRALDIDARPMPKGMTRQKENHTTYNRKKRCVNWQVELFVYGAPGLNPQPTRILHRALDNKPLSEVLSDSIRWKHGHLDWERRNQEQLNVARQEGRIAEFKEETSYQNTKKSTWKRKRAGPQCHQPPQSSKTSAWPVSNFLLQDSVTGQWNKLSDKGEASVPLSDAEEAAMYKSWHLYLQQPLRTAPGGGKPVIRLSPKETLEEALIGRTIVEFPTLYAFPPRTEGLPEGLVQVPAERRRQKDDTGSSDSESDFSSDSDSSSSSSSDSSSDASEEPATKKIKLNSGDREAGRHTDNRDNRNGSTSRGGRNLQQNWRGGRPERGGLRGRGRERGGGRGRGRGQQNPPRGKMPGRPGSSEGPGSNNVYNRGSSNHVPLGKRPEPESEEEGEVVSDDGGPPEEMDIDREPPGYHRSYDQSGVINGAFIGAPALHRSYGQTGMANSTYRHVESQPPRHWNGAAATQQTVNGAFMAEPPIGGNGTAVTQQPNAPGRGLVSYDSDSD